MFFLEANRKSLARKIQHFFMQGINTKDLSGCGHTDQHKDHTHQEPERSELSNMCREAICHGIIPGAGADSYCPTPSAGYWEMCCVSSTGADMWIWRISQGSSTLRGDAPPAALGPFPPSCLMVHHCSASLPAATATPNLLGRSSSFVNHPQGYREEPSREMT